MQLVWLQLLLLLCGETDEHLTHLRSASSNASSRPDCHVALRNVLCLPKLRTFSREDEPLKAKWADYGRRLEGADRWDNRLSRRKDYCVIAEGLKVF